MNKRLLILLTAVLMFKLNVFGGTEPVNLRIAGTSLAAGTTWVLADDKWPTPNSATYTTTVAYSKIMWGIDERVLTSVSAHTTAAEVQIIWSDAGGFNTTINNVTLTTSYDPAKSTNTFTYSNTYVIKGAYQVQVKLLRVYNANTGVTISTPSVPANLYLELEQVSERYYKFDPAYIQTYSLSYAVSHATISTNELEIYWKVVPGAEEYELEWAFADAYTTATNSIVPNPSAPVTFVNNATRIRTTNNKYTISLNPEPGTIYYRVRPIGRKVTISYPLFYIGPIIDIYDVAGTWSVPDFSVPVSYSTFIATSYGPSIDKIYTYTLALDENKNVQYSATYAEDGKKKEVISYFDGSLRNRQTVTRNNSEGQVIVGETYYDHQGRAAVNALPTPAYGTITNTPEKTLKYYEEYNLSNTFTNSPLGGQAQYSKKDFDLDVGGNCPTPANGMDNSRGSARYYSSSNPDQEGAQAYLPDAEEYPFSHTLYTPDNTGRVRKQSAPGNTFRMGNGHETSSLYGVPLQTEIDGLFGSEAGNNNRYQKNTVIDPNGQISISFLNKDGKVVATALAGNGTPNTNSLSAAPASVKTEKYFASTDQNYTSQNKFDGTALVFNYPIVPNVTSAYTFTYNLEVPQFTDACVPSFCYDCDYTLEMTIRDECGSIVYGSSPQAIPVTGSINYNCSSPIVYSSSSMSPALQATLTSGRQYYLQKKLSINSNGMDTYLAHYMDTTVNTCIKTRYYFNEQAAADIDLTDCGITTCSVCVAKVTAYILQHNDATKGVGGVNYDPDYVYITPTQTAAMIAKCNEACQPLSVCQNRFKFMMADLSPTGQYGQYDKSGNSYVADAYPLSVYNVNNMLPAGNANISQLQYQSAMEMMGFVIAFVAVPGNFGFGDQFLHCLSSYTTNNIGGYWRYPYFYNVSTHNFVPAAGLANAKHYYDDETGTTLSKVFVTYDGLAYTPSVQPGVTIKTHTNGLLYVYPEELLYLKDFIDNFKSSWGRSLVHKHPEWCYFEWCDEQSSPGPGGLSSEDYDNLLRATDSYSAALSNVQIGLTANTLVDDLINTDPYFANGEQGYNSPDAPYYPNNYLKTLLQYRLDNLISEGGNVGNAKEAANRIHRWATLYYNGITYTNTFGSATFPPVPGLTVTPTVTTAVTNREWTTYRDMYLAAKAEVQMIGAHIKAISRSSSSHCGCYNGCFGNPAFDPFNVSNDYNGFAYWQLILLNNLPWNHTFRTIYPSGGVNQPAQPCNWQTKSLYATKQKRFSGSQDLSSSLGAGGSNPAEIGAQLKKDAEYQTFQSTGQCPNSFRMLNFLNDMLGTNIMNSGSTNTVNLYLYPSFTQDLYDQVHGAPTYSNYFLTQLSSVDNNSMALGFCPGSPTAAPVCTIALSGAGSPAITWAQVKQFGGVQYNGGNNFSLLAWADDDNDPSTPTQEVTMTGTACITSTCSFPTTVCKANQVGKDLVNLFNNIRFTLKEESYATVYNGSGGTYFLNLPANPENFLITDALKSNSGFGLPSHSLAIIHDGIALPTFTTDPLVLSFGRYNFPFGGWSYSITYAPTVTAAPGTVLDATYFSNLVPDEYDPCKFYLTANFVNTVVVGVSPATIIVSNTQTFALVVNSTGSSCLTLGDCSEPPSMGCNTPGYKTLQDLKKFILELKTKNPLAPPTVTTNISGYTALTSNIKAGMGLNANAFVTFTNQLISNNALSIGFGSQADEVKCTLMMTPTPSVANWWNSMVGIVNLQADQGVAGAFNMTVALSSGSLITVTGKSCFKLENCDDCVVNAATIYTEDFDRFDGGNTPSVSDFGVSGNVTHSYGSYSQCSTVTSSGFGTATDNYRSTVTHTNSAFDDCTTINLSNIDQHTPPFGINPEDQDMLATFVDYEYTGVTTNTAGPGYIFIKTMTVTPGKSYMMSCWYNSEMQAVSTFSTLGRLMLRIIANTNTLSSVTLVEPGQDPLPPSWKKMSGLLPAYTGTAITISIAIDPNSDFVGQGHVLLDDIKIDQIDCDMKPPGPAVTASLEPECETQLNDVALSNGLINYKYYTDSVSASFKSRYINKCRQTLESLYGTFTDKVHHYTLYYYDQAGNLVKTVPPEGVNPVNLGGGNWATIDNDRLNGTQTFFTNHELATRYQYNSLNQLVTQSMPDHEGVTGLQVSPVGGGGALPAGVSGNDVDFYANGNTGFLAGTDNLGNGALYVTSDGGNNWSPASVIGSANVNKLQFMDVDYGFAVTSNGALLATTNGTDWKSYNLAPGMRMNSLYFYPGAVTNEYYGLVGGDNNALYHCYFPASGSPSFTQVTLPPGLSFSINAVKGAVVGTQRAFMVAGSGGVVLNSTLTANGSLPVFSTAGNLLNTGVNVNAIDFSVVNGTGPVLRGIVVGNNGAQGFAGIFNVNVSNPNINMLTNIIFTSLPSELKSVSRVDAPGTPSVITDDEINISGLNGKIYRLAYDGVFNQWTAIANAMPLGYSASVNHIEHGNKTGPGNAVYAFTSDGKVLGSNTYSSGFSVLSTTNIGLNGAAFISPYNNINPVHIAGNNGAIMQGEPVNSFSPLFNYTQLNSSPLNAVSVAKDNSGVVFAAGNSGILYKSGANGGAWAAVNTGTNNGNYTTVHAFSQSSAIVGDASGNYFLYVPNSMTAAAQGNVGNAISKIWFADNTTGHLVGNNDTYRRSTNGGSSFATVAGTVATGNDLKDVHFFGNTGLIVGSGATILRSINGGSNWASQTPPPAIAGATLRRVVMTDNATAYAFGDNGIAIRSMDGGVTWTVLPTAAPGTTFNAIAYNISAAKILAVGSGTSGNAFTINDQTGAFSDQFYYDQLGRLIISQNAKQYNKSPKAYSYTVYDALGRIINVGEVATNTDPATLTNYNHVIKQSDYTTWLSGGTKTEVTTTVYDNAIYVSSIFDQQNLRKRVSGTYTDTDDNLGNGWTYGTFYSYDVHGNVKSVMQVDYSLFLQYSIAAYRRINYVYDLLSGKVNEVIYEPGNVDEFRHKYEYDADNRLTNVLTSSDGGVNWRQDAKYFYYKHGPLARVELGNNKTQGLDYAYTLQGWIKGVNSAILSNATDAGKDSKAGSDYLSTQSGLHTHIGNDAYAYSLYYYTTNSVKDYSAINTSKYSYGSQTSFDADPTSVGFFGAGANNDLFNGNISGMQTTIPEVNLAAPHNSVMYTARPQLTTYKYDQLNRIREMCAYHDFVGNGVLAANAYTGAAATLTNTYRNEFTYDGNGNIETQKRYDDGNVLVDDLTYQYDIVTGGSPKKRSNRLYHINDAGTTAPGDINDMGTFTPNTTGNLSLVNNSNNYTYDEIGNLVKDITEEIDNIEWTVFGKIKTITRLNTSILPDMAFEYNANGKRTKKIVKPKSSPGVLVSANSFVTTYYTYGADGNVMGIYAMENADFKLKEHNIYGSSRLGSLRSNTSFTALPFVLHKGFMDGAIFQLKDKVSERNYELNNHLDNILATISDRKLPVDLSNNGNIDYFVSDITSANDYMPFGSSMPGRQYNNGDYRYGFNGKENDNEVKGTRNSQDYGMRIYDPRIGKFLSVDPMYKNFPWNSSYAFAENDVISCIDLEGLEKYKIVARSFAPRGSFEGTHFESKADNRTKFEIADYKKVSARIHAKLEIDLDAWTLGKEIYSQASITKPGMGLPPLSWPITSQKIDAKGIGVKQAKNMKINASYFAKNGTNVGPGIDIQMDFDLKYSESSNKLQINSKITGNVFPAQETMIFDQSGAGLFLGVSTAKGSPLLNVFGDGKENILSGGILTVQTDEDGNFKGVYSLDKNKNLILMSPDEYNKQYTDQKVWDGQDNRADYSDEPETSDEE